MREDILKRQASAMVERGLDAIIACSPENFAYAAGFVVPSQPLIRHRHAMVIARADGTASLFGVDMEESTIRRQAPDVPLSVWAEFRDDPMNVLADHLRGQNLDKARIGIEMDYLPAGDFLRLQAQLPGARFEAADALLSRLRQIKTTDEIALLRRLARTADQAIADSLAAVRCGDTELDIATVLTRRIYELGADKLQASDHRDRRTQPVAECRPHIA